MYLADGNTKPFSMNSALSSFLSSEISNLTGNALRTLDLSFGMDIVLTPPDSRIQTTRLSLLSVS